MSQLRDLAKRQLHANDLKISALLKENAALKVEVASLRSTQQPLNAIALLKEALCCLRSAGFDKKLRTEIEDFLGGV